jgi:hypothetical protein
MFKVTAIADMIICPAIRTSPTWAVWAHARRKFVDVNKGRKKARGKKKGSKGLADEALDYIGELYRIEKYARENEMTYDQIR